MVVLAGSTLGGGVVATHSAASASTGSVTASTLNLYVSPNGSDAASGLTPDRSLKTIQAALDRATAGVTIHLARGNYYEEPVTKVNGTAAKPIIVEGTDTGFDASKRSATVLFGSGRVFSINNSYYRLEGFSINGESMLPTTAYPTALAGATSFKDKVKSSVVDSTLVFIGAADTAHSLTGNVIDDMYLTSAGGACVRMRADANHNQIVYSTIRWCGMLGKYSGTDVFTYHNGEGVYIGTSPKSTGQPMFTDDGSSFNVVRGNIIQTFGSECFDVKENAHNNAFTGNVCGDNTEPLSGYGSNIELRGYDNSVTGNTVTGSLGYGLKIATDTSKDPQGGNVVQGNRFSADSGTPIRNDQVTAQGSFCGNTFAVGTYLRGHSVGSATRACMTSGPVAP
jgi:hypothetical protein